MVFGVLLYLASPFILAPSFRFPGFLPSSLCGSRRSSARTTHKVIVIFKSCATAGGYNTPPRVQLRGYKSGIDNPVRSSIRLHWVPRKKL